MISESSAVTVILRSIESGEAEASERLLPLVYQELRVAPLGERLPELEREIQVAEHNIARRGGGFSGV